MSDMFFHFYYNDSVRKLLRLFELALLIAVGCVVGSWDMPLLAKVATEGIIGVLIIDHLALVYIWLLFHVRKDKTNEPKSFVYRLYMNTYVARVRRFAALFFSLAALFLVFTVTAPAWAIILVEILIIALVVDHLLSIQMWLTIMMHGDDEDDN